MNTKDEIKIIEYALRNIFNKNNISDVDVYHSNRLFKKWKKLTKYKEDTSFIVDSILDEEPEWQTKNQEQ